GDGRAVAFAGTTIISSGYPAANTFGAFATYVRGDVQYEVRQVFDDPSATPSAGFGMRIAANSGVIAVADPGYDHVFQYITLSSSPTPPDNPARVEIYTRAGPTSDFAHSHTLENPTGDDASGFGLALSMDDNYLLVGAPFATVFGVPEAGAAFLYERRPHQAEFTRIATFLPPLVEARTHFGWSVAVVDGDEVFIGWPNYDRSEGRVAYYSDRSFAPWKLTRLFSPADLGLPESVDVSQFGASVAVMPDYGDIVAIGAPQTSEHPLPRPMVFIYEADSIDNLPYELTEIIEQPAVLAGARFGDALAFNTDFVDRILAVGSGNRDISGGIVNLYQNRRGKVGWDHITNLRNVNAGSIASFPYAGTRRILASGNDGSRAILYSEEAQCFPDLRGDANDDGVVDFNDLNSVLSQFGQTGEDLEGDVSGNGVVDFLDLNIVVIVMGAPCFPPQ
ncbi:MAG: hypothetical protein ACTS27_02990, partial [Phycisphaerales bacterium]